VDLICYTDAPTVITEYIIDEDSKKISDYHGCNDFSGVNELRVFEELIDVITNSTQWIEG